MIVAGIGYRSLATATDIFAVVRRAMDQAGLTAVDAMAIPAFKPHADEAPIQASTDLGVPLRRIGETGLAEAASRCLTRSSHLMPGCGYASVAEAAALAAVGPDGDLLVPRITNGTATCALASSCEEAQR